MNPPAMPSAVQRLGPTRWAGLLLALVLGVLLALTLRGQGDAASPAGVTVPASVRADPRDAPGSPLDMLDASLVQRDVRMILRVTTAGRWRAADLVAVPGRAVCLVLARRVPAIAYGRVCMTSIDAHPALTFTRLARDGTPGRTRRIGASVQRPRSTVLEWTFLPAAAGMRRGAYSWWLQADWTGPGACASTCTDRLPDAGAVAERLALLGLVPCFGAAARDRLRPCTNPALRLAVEPPPERAGVTLDPFCDTRTVRPISTCTFGAPPDVAKATFVLIGDSHAAAMKTALHTLTLARRWRGVSMLLSACPATKAFPILSTRARSAACAAWNGEVLKWLAAHPGIDAAFLSTHTTAEVKRADGKTMGETMRAGYRAEIVALLGLVRRVVVIRDTPFDAPGHLACIRRAMAARRAPGPACARPRRAALRPDPLAAAARDIASPRVTVVDFTSLVCDARRCLPVVGGALVHRDETHVTPAFSASLGPFILRALPAR